jgi:hypothetical protein
MPDDDDIGKTVMTALAKGDGDNAIDRRRPVIGQGKTATRSNMTQFGDQQNNAGLT